jgi:uncharacterized membrane protein
MKTSWRTEIVPVLCITVMFVLAVVAWPQAPDSIPIHWGLSGEPDNYAGKFFGLLGAPLIALGVYVLMFFLPRLDPKQENYARFRSRYFFIRNIIILMLFGIKLVTFLWVIGIGINMNMVVFIIAGLLLVLIGNYLGKLRQTWFIGIRTPWTLSSEESWNKTHRLGGRLFVLFGLVMIIATPFHKTWTYYVLGASGAVFIAFLYAYSYLVWKNDQNAGPAGTRLSIRKGS